MKVRIGTVVETGKPFLVDIPTFIETRGLVVANSGGGKSYLLRVLAERFNRYVQCGIFAKTDEFATIREKFDFLLCGDEKSDLRIAYHAARLKKDTSANEKHNERERHLEEESREAVRETVVLLKRSRQNFVVDLSAITHHEDRIGFAAAWCSALSTLPRKLWGALLFPIDEMHLLCPEEAKPASKQPVVDVFSLTRKMGVCGVGATQRFSKLDKDPEAECNNVFVGRSVLDEDLRRSAKLLGFGPKRWDEIKNAEPGEWFVFGPAFGSKEVIKVRIDEAETTHPRPGQIRARVKLRAPSARIQKALEQLRALPEKQEAERKATLDREAEIKKLNVEVARLKKELSMATKKVQVEVEVEERFVFRKGEVEKIAKAVDKLDRFVKQRAALLDQESKVLTTATEELRRLQAQFSAAKGTPAPPAARAKAAPRQITPPADVPQPPAGDGSKIHQRHMRVLAMISLYHPEPLDIDTLAALSDYAPDSRPFLDILRDCRAEGVIFYQNAKAWFTEEGAKKFLGPDAGAARNYALEDHLALWATKIDPRFNDVLSAIPVDGEIRVEDLAKAVNYAPDSRPYLDILRFLRRVGLINYGDAKVSYTAFMLRSAS